MSTFSAPGQVWLGDLPEHWDGTPLLVRHADLITVGPPHAEIYIRDDCGRVLQVDQLVLDTSHLSGELLWHSSWLWPNHYYTQLGKLWAEWQQVFYWTPFRASYVIPSPWPY